MHSRWQAAATVGRRPATGGVQQQGPAGRRRIIKLDRAVGVFVRQGLMRQQPSVQQVGSNVHSVFAAQHMQ